MSLLLLLPGQALANLPDVRVLMHLHVYAALRLTIVPCGWRSIASLLVHLDLSQSVQLYIAAPP